MSLVFLRVLPHHRQHQDGELLLSLLERNSGPQASKGQEPKIVIVVEQVAVREQLLFHCYGDPKITTQTCLAALKQRRRNTHNCIDVPIDVDRLTENRRVAAKMRLPQTVADDRDWRTSRDLVFGGEESTSQDRFHAQHIKIVRRDHRTPDAL